MNLKLSKIICFLFFLFCFNNILCQDLSLKISSTKDKDKEVLKNVKYKNKHKDVTSLKLEINRLTLFFKKNGYFLNSIDSLKNENKKFTAYFSLNKKIDSINLFVARDLSFLFNNSNDTIKIPVSKIDLTLSRVLKRLDNTGKPFSKVQLINILIKNKTLFADLDIYQSKKRIFNKVIVKGYNNFPKKYIRNYFDIKAKTIFSSSEIKNISNLSKKIEFIKEIKPPEILFTKDSTLLYLYLEKKQNNSFDGIVNFTTKEDGGILFNGNVDLKFNNILNKGEKLHLFWNSIGEERQEFKLSAETNYIFNTRFTPKLSFSIYRQDSTFFNTKFISDLYFNINPNTKIAINYNSESSENLTENSAISLETFRNYFLGFKFEYKIIKNLSFTKDIFFIEINPTIGKRTTNQNSVNQFKIETSSYYLWNIKPRSNIYIKNTIGFLNSDNFLNNEIFRIGGANSIRGFNEQSIFSNKFTYFNIEYRHTTSNTSFLYTISDLGFANSKSYLGLGLGYAVKNKNSLINISIAMGQEENKKLTINNSKFIVNWINYF